MANFTPPTNGASQGNYFLAKIKCFGKIGLFSWKILFAIKNFMLTRAVKKWPNYLVYFSIFSKNLVSVVRKFYSVNIFCSLKNV